MTGTKGKTTVATLAGELLRGTFPDIVVAGNMGITALGQLRRLRPDVPIVIELSSWQIESLLEHGLAPHIAVLTLIAEDHLNTYVDFADYAATKRGIARHQRAGDWLVVNRDDAESWRCAAETRATVVPFGLADRDMTVRGQLRKASSGAARAMKPAGPSLWRRRSRGDMVYAMHWRRWRQRRWLELNQRPSQKGSSAFEGSRIVWRRWPRSTA